VLTYGLRGSNDALDEGGSEECGIEGARAFVEPLIEGEKSRSSASKLGVAITTSSLQQNGRLGQPSNKSWHKIHQTERWSKIVQEFVVRCMCRIFLDFYNRWMSSKSDRYDVMSKNSD